MAKKQKMHEWTEEQKPQKQPTRKEMEKAILKRNKKRPLIKSSHG